MPEWTIDYQYPDPDSGLWIERRICIPAWTKAAAVAIARSYWPGMELLNVYQW